MNRTADKFRSNIVLNYNYMSNIFAIKCLARGGTTMGFWGVVGAIIVAVLILCVL